MNWNTLASTLLGALITYSAILLTQGIELFFKCNNTIHRLGYVLAGMLCIRVDSCQYWLSWLL